MSTETLQSKLEGAIDWLASLTMFTPRMQEQRKVALEALREILAVLQPSAAPSTPIERRSEANTPRSESGPERRRTMTKSPAVPSTPPHFMLRHGSRGEKEMAHTHLCIYTQVNPCLVEFPTDPDHWCGACMRAASGEQAELARISNEPYERIERNLAEAYEITRGATCPSPEPSAEATDAEPRTDLRMPGCRACADGECPAHLGMRSDFAEATDARIKAREAERDAAQAWAREQSTEERELRASLRQQTEQIQALEAKWRERELKLCKRADAADNAGNGVYARASAGQAEIIAQCADELSALLSTPKDTQDDEN